MSAAWVDHYKELQVDPDAEREVISSAYRRLTKKYNTDNGSSPDLAKMVRLNAAAEVLLDNEARTKYDVERRRRLARSSSSAVHDRRPASSGTYDPTITATPAGFDREVDEGKALQLVLEVRHIGGQLPPGWLLAVRKDGEAVDGATLSIDPPHSFPAVVRIEIPGKLPGEYRGSFELSIEQRSERGGL